MKAVKPESHSGPVEPKLWVPHRPYKPGSIPALFFRCCQKECPELIRPQTEKRRHRKCHSSSTLQRRRIYPRPSFRHLQEQDNQRSVHSGCRLDQSCFPSRAREFSESKTTSRHPCRRLRCRE